MATTIAEPVYWSALKKAGFRFAFIFFTSYVFFNPNGVYSNFITDLFSDPLHNFVNWFAQHVLHQPQPITVFMSGSGDTTYAYVVLLLTLILSIIAAIVWSLLDSKPRNYNKLYYWLTVIIRFYVGIMMIHYGLVKIVKLQFPSPSLDRLLETYGDSSPMGLAWTYLGYSTGFNYFAGFAELSCGLLLLFRRTALFGALLGVVVAGNIMVINYCFDVPVKLMSTALVVMCVCLLLREAERLVNVFFLNKTAPPSNFSPHRFKTRWKNITLIVVKYLILLQLIGGSIISVIISSSEYGDNAKKPPLYGIYKVDTFVRNNDTIPPLTTDRSRWSRLVISYINGARITTMNDSSEYISFKVDTLKHTIVINTYADTESKSNFTYTKPQPNVLLLKGKWQQDSLKIKFNRVDEKHFLLMNRGFHWISEYPFNR